MIDNGPTGLIAVSSVTFTFHGSDTNDTFQCSLDGAPWASCTSPQQYSSLADGTHTFQVRAVNAADEADPTPASASFTVEATPPQTTITSAPHGRVPTGEVSISFASTEAGSIYQCSLDGAAYSPCNSPDVIKDPAAGPHIFSVQATNQAGVKETAVPPSASWSSVEAQHDLCGTILSNTTIGPNYANVYTLDNCTLDVPSGVTLTVAPGAVIKASEGATCASYECSISVEGTLDAVGTASEPITFTSINDNSVGGATGTGSPGADEWYGIAAEGSGATLDIEHATIAYAQEAVQTLYSGAVTLNDDQIKKAETGLGSPNAGAGSPITLTNSSIDGGVDVDCAGSLTVTGNTVTGGIANYCNAVGSAVSSVVDIADNHVTIPAEEGGSPAISVAAANLDFAALASNTITAPSASNTVAVDGEVNVSQDMPATPFAWEIDGYATIDVPSGVTLTVKPGAVIKASEGSECSLEGCSTTCLYECSISVEGTLDAVGTASEPITFTSINDNSVGGATGTGSPGADEWYGIAAEGSGATLDIEHATIAYAQEAVQTLYSGAVTLNDDQIKKAETGLGSPNAGAGSPITLTNSSIDGGVDVDCAGSLTVTGNTVTGGIANYCNAVGSAVSSVVDIADNHVTIPAGDDNTPAISVAAANLNFAALASNTITAPAAANAIAVDGGVNVSQAMPATPFAWEIYGYATVDVPAGVTLTVASGTVIKSGGREITGSSGGPCFSYECSISVEGVLDAVGTAAEPITFTSINDNTIGGKTGSGTPAQGEWQGVSVGNEGEVDLAHATIDYATTGLSSTTDKHVTVLSDVFAHNSTALDISATLGTNAAIHETWFDENGVALAGSSDWTGVEPMLDGIPIESCRYVPVISATHNTFGPKNGDEPFISASEKADIENWQLVPETAEWPEEWTQLVEVGENDRIEWSVLPCQPVDVETGLPSGPPHVVVGIPFDIG